MARRPKYSAVMTAALGDHDWALISIKAHLKICSRCNEAVKQEQFASTCDVGWMLLKEQRRAAAQLRAIERDETAAAPVQLVLF